MSEEHVIDQLPAYALGGLEPDEQRQVERHVQGCQQCRSELRAYLETTAELAAAVPLVAPPDRVKTALLERVGGPTGASQSKARGGGMRAWLASTAPAWALAALVLLALLVATNLNRPETPAMVAGGEFALIRMDGTDEAPDATGVLVISPEGTAGSLIVDGLPRTDPDRQYQLWLIRDGQRTSGGVFSVDEEGYGNLVVESPQPLGEYVSFGITIEPAGGSPGPTGPRVLAGDAEEF